MNPVEAYLQELRDIRASGAVPETSGYGAPATLLTEVGPKLKPRVCCAIRTPRKSLVGRDADGRNRHRAVAPELVVL